MPERERGGDADFRRGIFYRASRGLCSSVEREGACVWVPGFVREAVREHATLRSLLHDSGNTNSGNEHGLPPPVDDAVTFDAAGKLTNING
jgi:hypothetical protein